MSGIHSVTRAKRGVKPQRVGLPRSSLGRWISVHCVRTGGGVLRVHPNGGVSRACGVVKAAPVEKAKGGLTPSSLKGRRRPLFSGGAEPIRWRINATPSSRPGICLLASGVLLSSGVLLPSDVSINGTKAFLGVVVDVVTPGGLVDVSSGKRTLDLSVAASAPAMATSVVAVSVEAASLVAASLVAASVMSSSSSSSSARRRCGVKEKVSSSEGKEKITRNEKRSRERGSPNQNGQIKDPGLWEKLVPG